jgi:hypothetical protein
MDKYLLLFVGVAAHLIRLKLLVESDRVVRYHPHFLNKFIYVLIVALKLNDFGCHVNNCFVGCIFYVDDIIIISASVYRVCTSC